MPTAGAGGATRNLLSAQTRIPQGAMFMRVGAVRSLVLLLPLLAAMPPGGAQEDIEALQGAQRLAATSEEAGQAWLAAVQARPDEPDLEAFAVELAARDDIARAWVDGTGVMAESSGGILIEFADEHPDVLGSGPASRVSPAAAPGRLAWLPQAAVANAALQRPRCHGDLIPARNALLIRPQMTTNEDAMPALAALLVREGYSVRMAEGDLCDYLAMASADVIIINTHGSIKTVDGEKHFCCIAEREEHTDVSLLVTWFRWLKARELAHRRAVVRDPQTGKPMGIVTGVAIFDTWFAAHIPRMVNNSAVLMICCHGADLETPWSVFREKGASVYFGFTGTVDNTWAGDWVEKLLDRVTGQRDDTPGEGAPPHRAQGFEDAFADTAAEDGFGLGCDWSQDPRFGNRPWTRAVPVLHTWWPGGSTDFSMHPHIDAAFIWRPAGTQDHLLVLRGAFGLADECQVLLDGRPLRFSSTSPLGGHVFSARLPGDACGAVQVVDAWGRHSNPITVSRFEATVEIDYDDGTCAGTIALHYREPVVASRLYWRHTDQLVFPCWGTGSAVGPQALERGADLITGCGDWALDWRFDSEREVDLHTVVVHDEGHASGRGPETGLTGGPAAWLTISPWRIIAPWHSHECEFDATLDVRVPLRALIDGRPAETEAVVGTDEVTGVYDPAEGIVFELDAEDRDCTWHMGEVRLTPDPYDPEQRM